jgi:hypothetical protein
MLRTRTRKGPEMSDEDEDESNPMRVQYKCPKCGKKVMLPHGTAEVEDEDEAVSPVTAKCSKGHTSSVAPPSGYRFVQDGGARESVRTFFDKYLRACSRQRSGGFIG